jgi:hypothetical protein
MVSVGVIGLQVVKGSLRTIVPSRPCHQLCLFEKLRLFDPKAVAFWVHKHEGPDTPCGYRAQQDCGTETSNGH